MTGEHPRRIAILTTTRADYGLLRHLLRAVSDHADMTLQLIVSGTHLAKDHGQSIELIRKDGFSIAAELTMEISASTGAAAAVLAGDLMGKMANALTDLQPDVLVVLGDRFEILSAVQAAWLCRVPVVHVHGGEVTIGAIDDGIRHAITKLSHMHFASTEEHAARICQLGEEIERVFVVGAPGLENILSADVIPKAHFISETGLEPGKPHILMTVHPETTAGPKVNRHLIDAILDALHAFPDATVLVTGSNADPGAADIMARIHQSLSSFEGRMKYHQNLGTRLYVAALHYCDVMLGNSSSGIIEAPSAGLPVVNVGRRQEGRPRAETVIDCNIDTRAIVRALDEALSAAMKEKAIKQHNPYAGSQVQIGAHMAQLIAGFDMASLLQPKPFIDLIGETGTR